MPNLTDELSTAKERRLNQFGAAVLVWCGKSVKFDRVCRTFVELNLGSTHGTPSESNVAPVSLQSRTYSVRFGTWKVRRLNQALVPSMNNENICAELKYLFYYMRNFCNLSGLEQNGESHPFIPRKKLKDASKGNGRKLRTEQISFAFSYPNLNKKKQIEQDWNNLLTEKKIRKARPNRIFILQVLYNSPLLLRGHLKWTQNISERVLLKHRRCYPLPYF